MKSKLVTTRGQDPRCLSSYIRFFLVQHIYLGRGLVGGGFNGSFGRYWLLSSFLSLSYLPASRKCQDISRWSFHYCWSHWKCTKAKAMQEVWNLRTKPFWALFFRVLVLLFLCRCLGHSLCGLQDSYWVLVLGPDPLLGLDLLCYWGKSKDVCRTWPQVWIRRASDPWKIINTVWVWFSWDKMPW